MIQGFVLIQLVGIAIASTSTKHLSYDREDSRDSYGHHDSRNRHGMHEVSKFSDGKGSSWNRINGASSSARESGTVSSRGHRDSGASHENHERNFKEKSGNRGRALRTKTFGFFNYKYIRPQYHIEQFRSDEKHSNNYDDDAFTSGGQHSERGSHHDKGHNSYAKELNEHGGHESFLESDEEDYGFKESNHDGEFEQEKAEDFEHESHGRGKKSESNYFAPYYHGRYDRY